MFSETLTFGLAALALVHAAPSFQTHVDSCNVNIELSVAPAHSFGPLQRGTYKISNWDIKPDGDAFTNPNVALLSNPAESGLFIIVKRNSPSTITVHVEESNAKGSPMQLWQLILGDWSTTMICNGESESYKCFQTFPLMC
ncbi:hypothetical protein DFH07DRAFT_763832 [Mycena maculata]|uniref:Uncharacterized protein n=1 Tax=Mycena maculata TaxID=230809 RepID=A0AAD7P2T4_9AGAR|nr:hypothetical protein DFH07DRAFT_763832 [Mycena maculata]